jgi:hypothetical protein
MEYVIVSYRSRSYTIKYANFLREHGISCAVVNTPKEAGVGCGLSVQIEKADFYQVKRAVFSSNMESFAGFFLVTAFGNKKQVRSI